MKKVILTLFSLFLFIQIALAQKGDVVRVFDNNDQKLIFTVTSTNADTSETFDGLRREDIGMLDYQDIVIFADPDSANPVGDSTKCNYVLQQSFDGSTWFDIDSTIRTDTLKFTDTYSNATFAYAYRLIVKGKSGNDVSSGSVHRIWLLFRKK